MGRMKLNHWFVDKNDLNISLMRFFIKIKRIINNKADYSILEVIDGNRESDIFGFPSIEEAVSFTENEIVESKNLLEIQEKYNSNYSKDKNSVLRRESDNNECDEINLSEPEVFSAIEKYYAQFDEKVKAKKNLRIVNGDLSLDFFKVQEFIGKKDIKIIETRLSEDDLRYIFEYYLKDSNYNLVDYKYIGGIRKVGYFVDEDTPYFEGIKLYIKGREKTKQKKES